MLVNSRFFNFYKAVILLDYGYFNCFDFSKKRNKIEIFDIKVSVSFLKEVDLKAFIFVYLGLEMVFGQKPRLMFSNKSKGLQKNKVSMEVSLRKKKFFVFFEKFFFFSFVKIKPFLVIEKKSRSGDFSFCFYGFFFFFELEKEKIFFNHRMFRMFNKVFVVTFNFNPKFAEKSQDVYFFSKVCQIPIIL